MNIGDRVRIFRGYKPLLGLKGVIIEIDDVYGNARISLDYSSKAYIEEYMKKYKYIYEIEPWIWLNNLEKYYNKGIEIE